MPAARRNVGVLRHPSGPVSNAAGWLYSGAVLTTAWDILASSAFFILVGFLLAAALDALVPSAWLVRLLRGGRKRSVFLATLLGAPLPLCSCSVLPTALALRNKGANKGATLSFLISTPETSVTSILLTYALLGPLLAIYRPIAACATAILAGLAELLLDRAETDAPAPTADGPDASATCADDDCGDGHTHDPTAREALTGPARWKAALRYAFVDLFDDIFGWVLIGILAAAALQVLFPPELLATILGGPLQSMLLMTIIGVPLYVCAEASTPIAAVLIMQGLNPGAALVFLLVGPATNIGAVGVLQRQLGRRTVLIYLSAIILVALAMGVLLNSVLAGTGIRIEAQVLAEPLVPAWLKTAAAVLFLALGIGTVWRARYLSRMAGWLDARLPLTVTAARLRTLLLGLTVVGYVLSGFYQVPTGSVGIHTRLGALRTAAVPPGLHYALPYPIDRVALVPVRRTQRLLLGLTRDDDPTSRTEGWTLVGDENMAALLLAVHWSPVEAQVRAFRYGVADPEQLVRSTVLGALREVVGGASINTILTTARPDAERAIAARAQDRLTSYGSGIRLDGLCILDAHAPAEVHAAFRDVASALEDRATRVNKARAQEARLIPAARAEAVGQVAAAVGYADSVAREAAGRAAAFSALLEVYQAHPALTRLRLELERLERVLPGLQKYIRPPAAGSPDGAGELEFWFVSPEAAANTGVFNNR